MWFLRPFYLITNKTERIAIPEIGLINIGFDIISDRKSAKRLKGQQQIINGMKTIQ